MSEDGTARRKDAHLDLCAQAEVEPEENNTLFDCVRLVHCAMPEMAVSDVSLTTELFGKTLRHPLMVTGMTGGTDRAEAVNRDLATLAEKYGLAFGVGSQRAMAEDASRAKSFQVRAQAPKTLLLGNIGLRQAAAMGPDGVKRLRDAIGADGMALHLNVGQELTQPEGDRDFTGGYATVEALVAALDGRLLVKETGCGISPQVAKRLCEMGVRALDVSGLGGTSWVRVEQLRADGVAAQVGAEFAGWGIPTAAAVASVRKAVGPSVRVIASGGIRTGLDVAKCLALGADLAGMALPLFRAQQEGGLNGAERALKAILQGLTQAMVLTGSRSPQALGQASKVVTQELATWLLAL
jgi:isopentenyl-diphosphate delta-isomerase